MYEVIGVLLEDELKKIIVLYKKKQTRPVVKIRSHIIKLWNSTIHSIICVAESCGEICQISAASQKENEKELKSNVLKTNKPFKGALSISDNKNNKILFNSKKV